MLPGDHLPVDEKEDESNQTKAQPLPASQEAPGLRRPQCDPQKPTCPRCDLTVPDPPPALPPSLSRVQGSSSLVHSSSSSGRRRNRSRDSVASSHQPAATLSDTCFNLLLACLSCELSLLPLGLLEACYSCLHPICSSCCHACARCCSAIQEAPVEEFNCHAHCHSVLFESCCEPIDFLEFCLECCEICHHS
ncbi:myoD family inhibitor domain-containing protein-like isoform X2 [Seriola dumerili]|uniref:myoD family inhibitor domain-containing protein-like isoform X2 n=1 Tax=Seriola dumerili TaxID=41447 RepID=UPI000BBE12B7|nr:myoD family inhibitor domain-containing protein-like isoform X2 [Seriola dumerili]